MTVIRKLLVPTLLIFAFGLLGVTALGVYSIANSLQKQESADLNRSQQLFQNRLIELESFALALATEVANNPEVQAAFAAGDRERLIELTLPAYERLDEQFDVPQHGFHQPPAISYLRLHQPALYGEDLTLYRPSVVLANAEQRPVSGPEVGRSGLGVRGVVPVTYLDDHVGTVEFGLNVDETLLEEMKEQFGVDWQILLSRDATKFAIFDETTGETKGPTPDLLLQASTLEQPFFAEDELTYRQVLNGSSLISHRKLDDQQFALFSYPLRDFSGNIIGVVEAITDQTPAIVERNLGLTVATAVSIVVLIVGGGILAVIATRTLKPVGELTEAATVIAGGDLNRTIPVPTKGEDEIAKLARALDSMTVQLRSLIGSLEERVADRMQRLETITVLSERVSAILDVDELLAEVVNQIQENFGYYHAHIYLLDETGESMVVAEGTGPAGAEMKERGHSIAISAPKSLVAQAARTGQVTKVDNVLIAEGWLPNPLLPDTHAEMAVPITLEDQVVGVLDVQEDKIGGLDESDATLLRSVANQVAVAIRNARLFAELEVALAESRAAHERYLQQAWQAIESRGQSGHHLYQRPEAPPLNEAVVSQLERAAKKQNRPAIIDVADGETAGTTDQPHTALVAPIRLQDQTIGAIQIQETEAVRPRSWTERELALVQAVADQVAQVAENIRLFEETRERVSFERLTSEITGKLRQAPTLEALVKVASEELGQALGVAHSVVKVGDTPATKSHSLPGKSNGQDGEDEAA